MEKYECVMIFNEELRQSIHLSALGELKMPLFVETDYLNYT